MEELPLSTVERGELFRGAARSGHLPESAGANERDEYPAAHATVGASVLGFYTVWFGTDQFPLAFKGNGGAVRYYTNVNEIHTEEGNARVWGGMHWRNSTEVGTALGSRVGKYTATHLLKPLDD